MRPRSSTQNDQKRSRVAHRFLYPWSLVEMKLSPVGISSLIFAVALSVNAFAQAPVAAPAATPAAPTATTAPAAATAAPSTAPAAAKAPAPAPEKKASAPAAAGAMEGKIAHYGSKFNGRKTACGVIFNAKAMTMASKSLPCGTMVKVTNLKNKKSVIVMVTDRGPSTPDRIGDVTTAAARKLGMTGPGVIEAKLSISKAGGKGKKKMMKKAKKK
jgi:rare lipoprotein A